MRHSKRRSNASFRHRVSRGLTRRHILERCRLQSRSDREGPGQDGSTPTLTAPGWRTTMSIRATILASALSLPLVAGAALAADTGNRSLVDAAKQGDRNAVQSLLNGPTKQEIAATQGGAALIWAASHNDKEMVDLLLGAGADP